MLLVVGRIRPEDRALETPAAENICGLVKTVIMLGR